jgi:hypothetical protein
MSGVPSKLQAILARPNGEAARQNKITERAKPSHPLLTEWPEGYTSFKLDGDDVLLFGEDKPPLRIKG